ncbi:MAG: hypothetical protein HN348_21100 [Proteobacteria bacterium]|nr:hypothetical protein [Pseudomonadota bacterium]
MAEWSIEKMDAIIARLRQADWKTREAIKNELLELVKSAPNRPAVESQLQAVRPTLPLELRWDIDEILEVLNPPKQEVDEEPEEEVADPNAPLTASDLNVVYDDPRGVLLHKSKKGDRYFLTQRDPQTGQPQTFELHQQEVDQIKGQLKGSPYWVIGSGD